MKLIKIVFIIIGIFALAIPIDSFFFGRSYSYYLMQNMWEAGLVILGILIGIKLYKKDLKEEKGK